MSKKEIVEEAIAFALAEFEPYDDFGNRVLVTLEDIRANYSPEKTGDYVLAVEANVRALRAAAQAGAVEAKVRRNELILKLIVLLLKAAV